MKSDQLKSDFIKIASHELKTPVTSIKAYVQLLLAQATQKDKQLSVSMLRSSLTTIDKQVTKLTRLLSELLDISKIEAGQLLLHKENFSLNDIIVESMHDILHTNPHYQINLHNEYMANVYGDKDRIGQVMINLLTNAIKYSPNSTTIDITIFQPAKNSVAVSIQDFGIGVDNNDQRKIFDRFYRGEGATKHFYPGFGIGLFIVKDILQRHGGTISVKSEKGKGSTFTFTLPSL